MKISIIWKLNISYYWIFVLLYIKILKIYFKNYYEVFKEKYYLCSKGFNNISNERDLILHYQHYFPFKRETVFSISQHLNGGLRNSCSARITFESNCLINTNLLKHIEETLNELLIQNWLNIKH